MSFIGDYEIWFCANMQSSSVITCRFWAITCKFSEETPLHCRSCHLSNWNLPNRVKSGLSSTLLPLSLFLDSKSLSLYGYLLPQLYLVCPWPHWLSYLSIGRVSSVQWFQILFFYLQKYILEESYDWHGQHKCVRLHFNYCVVLLPSPDNYYWRPSTDAVWFYRCVGWSNSFLTFSGLECSITCITSQPPIPWSGLHHSPMLLAMSWSGCLLLVSQLLCLVIGFQLKLLLEQTLLLLVLLSTLSSMINFLRVGNFILLYACMLL